jgi:hypothetical protein
MHTRGHTFDTLAQQLNMSDFVHPREVCFVASSLSAPTYATPVQPFSHPSTGVRPGDERPVHAVERYSSTLAPALQHCSTSEERQCTRWHSGQLLLTAAAPPPGLGRLCEGWLTGPGSTAKVPRRLLLETIAAAAVWLLQRCRFDQGACLHEGR